MLTVAAGAWIGTVVWARRTGNGPGTMGLSLFQFVGMWALMMTAMMLPAVGGAPGFGRYTPLAASGSGQRRIWPWVLTFAFGYLLVWAATGLPAYGLAVAEGRLVGHHPDVAISGAAAIFALAGLYQFTPAKQVSLARCRDSMLQPSAHSGVGAGVVFGAWCLACSWAAIGLLIVFGVMNIAAMVVLAAVVFVERRWFIGRTFTSIVGAVVLAGGVLVVLWPSLAAGIRQMPSM
jgi:predicted metal-binding membrane protein